MMIW